MSVGNEVERKPKLQWPSREQWEMMMASPCGLGPRPSGQLEDYASLSEVEAAIGGLVKLRREFHRAGKRQERSIIVDMIEDIREGEMNWCEPSEDLELVDHSLSSVLLEILSRYTMAKNLADDAGSYSVDDAAWEAEQRRRRQIEKSIRHA